MTNSLHTMEEQWLKANTDCVYFLASPLTCKKGIECEYRHSEYARLHPVDCRYWLSGNCLNENCGFRHPPLDGLNEESLDSASTYQQTPASVTKYNVPCRFFLNGYCNKGENCFFLHGPSDYDSRVSMEFSAVMDKPAVDKKITMRNGISSDASVPANASHAVTYSPAFDKVIAAEGDTRSAIPIAIHANPSATDTRTSVNAKIAMGNYTRHGTPVVAEVDPSKNYSQKRVGIDIEPEVKTLRATSNIISSHIPNQQPPGPPFQENATRRMNPPLLSRVFTRTFQAEQRSGYQVDEDAEMEDWNVNQDDPDGFPCEYESVDLNLQHPDHSYVGSGNDIPLIHVNTKPSSARRRNMQTRITYGSMDLRQILIKRRRLSNAQDYFSGTNRSSQNGKRYEQTGHRYLRGRLASNLAFSNGVRSHIVSGSSRKSSFRQKWPWHSRTGKTSQHFTGRWGKQSLKARKSKSFEGFSEITEPSTGTAEDDFERPRSLCEILKEKRMLKSEVVLSLVEAKN